MSVPWIALSSGTSSSCPYSSKLVEVEDFWVVHPPALREYVLCVYDTSNTKPSG